MTIPLGMVAVDTTNALALARWWAEQLHAEIVQTNDEWYVEVRLDTPPILLAFQQISDPTPGKNRLHLDLTVPDVDAAVEQLTAAGAGLVERRSIQGFAWVTLTDPDGNQFCISTGHASATAT